MIGVRPTNPRPGDLAMPEPLQARRDPADGAMHVGTGRMPDAPLASGLPGPARLGLGRLDLDVQVAELASSHRRG